MRSMMIRIKEVSHDLLHVVGGSKFVSFETRLGIFLEVVFCS